MRTAGRTLRDRANEWFGKGNLAEMTEIRVSRRSVAFACPHRLVIYSEDTWGNSRGEWIGLDPKRRDALVTALEGNDGR